VRGVRVEPIQVFSDPRGSLHKLLPGPVSGEVYLVRAEPGARRGDHRHERMGEWFTALSGSGVLAIVDPATGERAEYDLRGARVYVPAGLVHTVIAGPDEPFEVLAFADRLHDPGDVFPAAVSPGGEP